MRGLTTGVKDPRFLIPRGRDGLKSFDERAAGDGDGIAALGVKADGRLRQAFDVIKQRGVGRILFAGFARDGFGGAHQNGGVDAHDAGAGGLGGFDAAADLIVTGGRGTAAAVLAAGGDVFTRAVVLKRGLIGRAVRNGAGNAAGAVTGVLLIAVLLTAQGDAVRVIFLTRDFRAGEIHVQRHLNRRIAKTDDGGDEGFNAAAVQGLEAHLVGHLRVGHRVDGVVALAGQQAAGLIDHRDIRAGQAGNGGGDEADDRADLFLFDAAPLDQLQKDRGAGRLRVADKGGALGQGKVDARGLDHLQFGDGTGQFQLLHLAQTGALDRAAGAHGHVGQGGIAVRRPLGQADGGKDHLGAVVIVAGDANVAGGDVEVCLNPAAGQGVQRAGLVGLGHRGEQGHLAGLAEEHIDRQADHGGGDKRDAGQGAAHTWLVGQALHL